MQLTPESKIVSPIVLSKVSDCYDEKTYPLRYAVAIKYSDIKNALEAYDKEKGTWKKLGVRDDNENICKLRELFNSFKATPSNLSTLLTLEQLWSLAKILSRINDVSEYFKDASSVCVEPLKNLLGRGRCGWLTWCREIKLQYFIDFFRIPEDQASFLSELTAMYYDKFPVVRKTVVQHPELTGNLCRLLKWLSNRGLLNEKNVSGICFHVDSIDLFIDAANVRREYRNYGGPGIVDNDIWITRSSEVQDVILQQMLFDAIIKRAAQKKETAILSGLKDKNSVIWKFFGTKEKEVDGSMCDLRVFREVFNFLRMS